MVKDTVSDLFTRIRNALQQRHSTVNVAYSKMNFSILQILVDRGFITSFNLVNKTTAIKYIVVTLKYRSDGSPMISEIQRKSKSSKRIYVPKKQIPKIASGFGECIISTSMGVLTGRQARLKNIGGELIGTVQ